VNKQPHEEESAIEKKFVLKPPVSREDLLRYSENHPDGAEDFLELLCEFRKDGQQGPKSI